MNFRGITWDEDMVTFCFDNLKNAGSILLGRVTAEAFIPYWKDVAENPDPDDSNRRLGKPIHALPKVVFSNGLKANMWDNTTILKGDFEEEVNALKRKNGKDIMVSGGTT